MNVCHLIERLKRPLYCNCCDSSRTSTDKHGQKNASNFVVATSRHPAVCVLYNTNHASAYQGCCDCCQIDVTCYQRHLDDSLNLSILQYNADNYSTASFRYTTHTLISTPKDFTSALHLTPFRCYHLVLAKAVPLFTVFLVTLLISIVDCLNPQTIQANGSSLCMISGLVEYHIPGLCTETNCHALQGVDRCNRCSQQHFIHIICSGLMVCPTARQIIVTSAMPNTDWSGRPIYPQLCILQEQYGFVNGRSPNDAVDILNGSVSS